MFNSDSKKKSYIWGKSIHPRKLNFPPKFLLILGFRFKKTDLWCSNRFIRLPCLPMLVSQHFRFVCRSYNSYPWWIAIYKKPCLFRNALLTNKISPVYNFAALEMRERKLLQITKYQQLTRIIHNTDLGMSNQDITNRHDKNKKINRVNAINETNHIWIVSRNFLVMH